MRFGGAVKVGAAALGAVILSGCTTTGGPANLTHFSEVSTRKPGCKGTFAECKNNAYFDKRGRSMSLPEARASVVDRTSRSVTHGAGTQVRYLAPDGRLHVWRSGESSIVHGQWKVSSLTAIIRSRDGMAAAAIKLAILCFREGGGGGQAGRPANWTCGDAADYIRVSTLESAMGDIFGLSSREQAPAVLGTGTYSFATLQRLADR